MSKKDQIIFIAKYRYLALPHFISIVPHLENIDTIYLELKDPGSYPFIQKSFDDAEKLTTAFTMYKEIEFEGYQDLLISLREKKYLSPIRGFRKISAFRKYKKHIKQILETISPNAIVSSSDMALIDRIVTEWCKENRIPFIVIQPSFIEGVVSKAYKKASFGQNFKYYLSNKLLGAPTYLKQSVFGNEAIWSYLLLWSQYFVLDKKRKRTYFIGNPAFDRFFKEFETTRSIKNTVLICTENIDELFGKKVFHTVNDILKSAIKERSDLIFYLKIHPREPKEKYSEIFIESEFPNVRIVKDEIPLYELFKKCDLQISVNSYSSIEAAAMGLPVITITPDFIYENIIDHFKGIINIRVIDKKGILDAISQIYTDGYWSLFSKKREKYYNQIMYSTDGESGLRAAKVIKSIIRNI
ncbi:MAG: DUF354 domain-containing protein [Candidatus Hodarchaeales archaeon]|jgi:hypothetical protein